MLRMEEYVVICKLEVEDLEGSLSIIPIPLVGRPIQNRSLGITWKYEFLVTSLNLTATFRYTHIMVFVQNGAYIIFQRHIPCTVK